MKPKLLIQNVLFIPCIAILLYSSKADAQSTKASNTWNATRFLGWDATNAGGDLFFKTNNITRITLQNTTGFLGIGTTTPATLLSIGAASEFRVNSNGNIRRINDVAYSFPSAQGAIGTMLQNDGSGNLSWSADAWSRIGNSGTVDGTHFIGNTDNVPINFRINNLKAGRIDPAGPVFLGYRAGNSNTAVNNTGIGFNALFSNTTGNSNTASGHSSLRSNITGSNNTSVGFQSGFNTTGSGNVFLGNNAGFNETGSNKLYIANSNTNPPLIYGDFSTARVGLGTITPAAKLDIAGKIKITDGSQGTGKVLTSDAAGLATWTDISGSLPNGSASGNTIYWDGGLWSVDAANFFNNGSFIGIGTTSPAAKLDVVGNIKITDGTQGAGKVLTSDANGLASWMTPDIPGLPLTGSPGIVFVGYQAGNGSMDYFNTGVGYQVLYSNTTGTYNTAHGFQTLYSNTTGTYNTGYGFSALYLNTTGELNTAGGMQALYSNTTGSNNSAYGAAALALNNTGANNTAIGCLALELNLSGNHNTANGEHALFINNGSSNTAVGRNALFSNYSGNNNTALGADAFYDGGAYSNSTAIGYNTQVTGDNIMRFGNEDITSIGGQVGWTTLSDKRFKKNIDDKIPGLEFITKLRPITYHLDMDAIASFLKIPDSLRLKKSEVFKGKMLHTGFIAQEVEKAAQEIGFDFSGVDKPKNENDYYGLRYAEFVVPLVKAVQEQQSIITNQAQKTDSLQKQVDELKAILEKLSAQVAVLQNNCNPITKNTNTEKMKRGL